MLLRLYALEKKELPVDFDVRSDVFVGVFGTRNLGSHVGAILYVEAGIHADTAGKGKTDNGEEKNTEFLLHVFIFYVYSTEV